FKLNNIGIYPNGIPFETADHHISKIESIGAVIESARKQHTELRQEDIVYIGDRLYDYRTSQTLGIRFIGIDNRERGELQEGGAPIILTDLSNKNAFYASLNKA